MAAQAPALHLIKLSVGTESVEDLAGWQQGVIARNAAAGLGRLSSHVTRMWPTRTADLLSGGSIFWVIRGQVLCRQRLVRFDERIGEDGIRRCALMLDPELVRTFPQPRAAFQGWRYLRPQDAPSDLQTGGSGDGQDDLPMHVQIALSDIGVR
jgi:hypothetical protein